MSKLKLQKEDGHYYLMQDGNEIAIATTDKSFINELGAKELSKQNCDQLFGVVDVEMLAEENYPAGDDWTNEESLVRKLAFKNGFNEAMELNEDKLFTVEDMKEAYGRGFSQQGVKSFNSLIHSLLQSLQQPTEIEVEIEMELVSDGLDEMAQLQHKRVPKLDKNGCLILKKK